MAEDQSAQASLGAFGPNAWLVDDMFEQYRQDPTSVSESWQEFFADYGPPVPSGPSRGGRAGPQVPESPEPSPQPSPPSGSLPADTPAQSTPVPTQTPAPGPGPAVVGTEDDEEPRPQAIRGAKARIVANMEESLGVPTATSIRPVPAKLLEVNRTILNNHLRRTSGGKVSFTHLIGFAVVQALSKVPAMNASFVADSDGKGTPGVLNHAHVGLGLAVDVEKKDGSRTLLVPCIKGADTLDFKGFLLVYEDLIRKVRTNRITPDDFVGTTVSLTNPGTIGTELSVPRLMPGQGLIVGVGALDYPVEFQAADEQMLAQLGVSKVLTLTSTYDHRIIQGAESGMFLARLGQLLRGEDGFYDSVFRSMGVPYEPVRWRQDHNPVDQERSHLIKQVHVQTLINMYRVRGHLIADLDPLRAHEPHMHPELDPATYGLTLWDLEREFMTDGLAGRDQLSLGDILGILRDAYCRTVGVEYMHIQEPDQKRWIQQQVEGVPTEMAVDDQRYILARLNAAEAFERFLHTKYIGQKRFGLEGAESAVPLIDTVLDDAAQAGMAESVIGMAHRGRLNILANIVGKSFGEIFREFEGDIDPDTVQGSGDVKYHKGASGKFVGQSGLEMPVTLASNPSHLEAVDPVVEGMVRAKQDILHEGARYPVLSLLIHGDAAFAGQGVVAETLNLSGLRGYRTGGTVHLVINNQLGFTTSPESARSSVYATDVAKMVQAPIFHVNGDDPEACVRVGHLAFAYRQAFRKDVVIDMVCYRRYGHNEGDEPSYTQPQMYELIQAQRSVRKRYTETLVLRGDITIEQAEHALDDFSARLQSALDETRSSAPPQPTAVTPPESVVGPQTPAGTGVGHDVLDRIASALHDGPASFTIHPKLARQLQARAKVYAQGQVDWALAEALAVGSILLDGHDVRLAGQDTRRGTFSQRHAVLVDYHTGSEHVPLSGLAPEGDQGRFFIYDSLLSEYAALGFEYGYSVSHPDALVMWEAQFGDFINGAQIVIDQFIVAADDKWGQSSGLVLLLPHGYEGQGPEHSSARLERFLTLAADGNMIIANLSTSAQYFHLLRAQVKRPNRRPLVIFTPKSLLRARQARSPVGSLTESSFQEVLDDPRTSGSGIPVGTDQSGEAGSPDASPIDPQSVTRLILCSGKVAYDAMARRDKLIGDGAGPVSAVIRVEQIYPWPDERVAQALARYEQAKEVVWLQEEPENMGSWSFVHGRLHALLRNDFDLRHVSRYESGSPASGSAAMHALETQDILDRALR